MAHACGARRTEEPRGLSQETARLLPIVAPLVAAATAVTALAVNATLAEQVSASRIAGALVLLAAATAAEAYPVPLEGVSAGGISLAASFLVGAALLYDWHTAILLSLAARGLVELAQRRPPIKLLFNSAVFALSGAAAGGVALLAGRSSTIGGLLIAVTASSFAFYGVNIPAVAAVVARASNAPFLDVLRRSIRWTALPFAIMASISLMLAVLWQRSPILAAALAGPLVAVGLYQRSVNGALEAMRLAKTDPLTGLGNHRAFHETLAGALEWPAAETTLCLIDADGFKQINDRHGHQAGDRVLTQLGAHLRHDGEAFRLGGDEFALVLRDTSLERAVEVARAIVRRVGHEPQAWGGAATVSVGLASWPEHALDPDRLIAAADVALYQAKRRGRNQVHAYDPRVARLAYARRDTAEEARLHAAWGLAELVDAAASLRADGSAALDGHPRRVAELAARLATRAGLEPERVELVRLAARLHDLGKLAVPVEILSKPGSLAAREWRVLEEHPETGRRILTSLGAGALADWVLHHHERWDGAGYPSRLAGEEIPLPARIIFVADAFDAITCGRPYRRARSEEDAVEELRACAGTQFDPGVVAVLIAELEETRLEQRLSA